MTEIMLILALSLFINEHFISKELRLKLNEETAVSHVLTVISEDLLQQHDEYAAKIYELERQISKQEAEESLGC